MNWLKVLEAIERVARAGARRGAALVGRVGGEIIGRTEDGDIETEGDRAALESITEALHPDRFPWRVGLLSERDGKFLPLANDPELLIVCDEVDGSRPAACGLNCAATSLACLPADVEPILGNVTCGVICTFAGVSYGFARGEGVWRNGQRWLPPADATPTGEARLFFEMVNGGNMPLVALYLADFERNVRRGVLSIASSCIAACSICEGAAHGHLHLGRRLWDRWPELREEMARHYGPEPGNHGYDVAAAAPLLVACGRAVSDAYGGSLANLRLDDVSRTFSYVAASSEVLLADLLQTIDRRERWLQDRADAILPLLRGPG